MLRMPYQIVPKQAIHCRLACRRRVGRPSDVWLRPIEGEVRERNLNLENIEARAHDRDAWREFVADPCTTRDQKMFK